MENTNYALVTGASSGIGRAIADELAKRKFNLILHSLPGQSLAEICDELMVKYKIHALYHEIDLTTIAGPQSLFDFVMKNELKVNVLVNNAGIGFDGPVESYSAEQIDYMIFLNIRALTLLTSFITPELKKNRKAYILNLSSFGCYTPTAFKSVYLATKAYIYYFTRALDSEFTGTGVSTCVILPSAVRTNINVLDRIKRGGWFSRKSALNPEEVASAGVKALLRGKKAFIPGRLTRLFFAVGIFLPEIILLYMTRRIFSNFRRKS
jgi:short-subunit dehydrogenase